MAMHENLRVAASSQARTVVVALLVVIAFVLGAASSPYCFLINPPPELTDE